VAQFDFPLTCFHSHRVNFESFLQLHLCNYHAMTSEPAPIAQPPTRSVLVTALAWVVIVVGAVLTPISIISFLMLLVRSYGTSTGGVAGLAHRCRRATCEFYGRHWFTAA
jgi:hypothetical protein